MKLLFALILSCVVLPVFADDAPAVVDRVGCSDISLRISELGAIEVPSDEQLDELTELKVEYRKKCVVSARGRRTSADAHVVTQEVAMAETTPEQVVDTSEVVLAEQVVAEPEPVQEEITPEQELANLDAGLCADGSAPNRFGCCGDEIFKDLGDTVFACCPRGDVTGDCFPPLK
ncbi:MAG: hypothetical protein IIV74_02800 [Alphaproteobacteria bacterium]|nr:hypothetical protein [Alphaproteobacteria bacterium]